MQIERQVENIYSDCSPVLKKIIQNFCFKNLHLQLTLFLCFSKHQRYQLFSKQILTYAVLFLMPFFTVRCMWYIYIPQLYFSGVEWINIYFY